jgi:hypothetical protein
MRASQYTGVILSIPSRVPTNTSVGWKSSPGGFAIFINSSSYTSGPSPVEYTLMEGSWEFVNAL